MTNFCRLPPDSDRAALPGPGGAHVEAGDDLFGARRGRGGQVMKPAGRKDSGAPCRSGRRSRSGSCRVRRRGPSVPRARLSRPRARRGVGGRRLTVLALQGDGAGRGGQFARQGASSSSSWPLPATPPMPSTSPRLSVSATSFSAMPKGRGEAAERPATVQHDRAGLGRRLRAGTWRAEPTIISAIARAEVGARVAGGDDTAKAQDGGVFAKRCGSRPACG